MSNLELKPEHFQGFIENYDGTWTAILVNGQRMIMPASQAKPLMKHVRDVNRDQDQQAVFDKKKSLAVAQERAKARG